MIWSLPKGPGAPSSNSDLPFGPYVTSPVTVTTSGLHPAFKIEPTVMLLTVMFPDALNIPPMSASWPMVSCEGQGLSGPTMPVEPWKHTVPPNTVPVLKLTPFVPMKERFPR